MPSAGSIWTAPDAINHLCRPRLVNGTLTRTSEAWKNVIMPQTKVLRDIMTGQLPDVSWVIPSGQASDHPYNNEGSGPSWVAAVVNATGTSRYWPGTAIFVTWDDWGGFYDHVQPPIYNSYEYGFRLPLMVISPYAKPSYISHKQHDQRSWWNLPHGVCRWPEQYLKVEN